MPRATVDIANTQRFELKTAPPDGYVVLRRLTYGQWLHRQESSLAMKMQASHDGRKGAEADVVMAAKKVAVYEFANCIVEHNLEDHEGNLLDFKKEYVLELLDPRIGQEIGDCITSMNEFEADLGN